jgi:8-oxo-dGTP diphosphatase
MQKITEVAVAIFLKADGSFLLSSRPEGKPYPGYWEFPGGKIESGESVRDALVRELIEELNVTITHATPWFTFMMHYTHATVRLHCWRVTAWQGDMRGLEGQAFAWQAAAALANNENNALTVMPTLPGCVPIFNALKLPRVYAITNASEIGVDAYLTHLRATLNKNASNTAPIGEFGELNIVPMIQIREKQMSQDAPAAFSTFTREVLAIAREHGAKVLINSASDKDIAFAQTLKADGVHLTGAHLATLDARPDFPLVGASIHSRAELERAAQLKCDFTILGAVNATPTHPGQAPMGWPAFAGTTNATPIPCYALGGLRMSDMVIAIEHGAHGIALQRGF